MESVATKLTDPNMVILTLPSAESAVGEGGITVQAVEPVQLSAAYPDCQNCDIEAADLLDYLGVEVGYELRTEREPPMQIVMANSDDIILAEDNGAGKNAFAVLLDRLQEVEVELQAAGYAIGTMQAELESYKEKTKLLPDFEAQALKLAEVERQNRELRKRLPEYEGNAKQIAQLQRENDELRWQLEEHYSSRRRRMETSAKLTSIHFWQELISQIGRRYGQKGSAGSERQSKLDRNWAMPSAHSEDNYRNGERF